MITVLLITVSCAKDDQDNWTILVYMAADSNLADQAYQDIVEMQQAHIDNDINVIVQLDPRQIEGKFPDSQARRYKISHSNLNRINSPIIEYLGDIDSGDYLNLVDFVNWGISKYPARYYSLIIWSHGDGWTRNTDLNSRAICPDETHISIASGDFKKAFEMFKEKMNLLIVDACLMHTLEVLAEIYHRTDYVLGSQTLIPYEGFPYGEILESWNSNQTIAHIALRSLELFVDSHLPGGSQNPRDFERRISGSVMKSSQYPDLLNNLKVFVTNYLANQRKENADQAREACYGFHIGKTEVDIKEFLTHLRDTFNDPGEKLVYHIDNLLISLEKTFIGQKTINLPDNTGTASVWFPTDKDSFQGSKELYGGLNFPDKTNWIDFLETLIVVE